MNDDVQLLSAVIVALVIFLLGVWVGRVHEQGHQADLRIDYSVSKEFTSLPIIEKNGALAMWKWLREHS